MNIDTILLVERRSRNASVAINLNKINKKLRFYNEFI